jgi:hypothetical protein
MAGCTSIGKNCADTIAWALFGLADARQHDVERHPDRGNVLNT